MHIGGESTEEIETEADRNDINERVYPLHVDPIIGMCGFLLCYILYMYLSWCESFGVDIVSYSCFFRTNIAIMQNVRWLPPLAAVFCGLLTIERAWSRDHATSLVTAVLPPPGQRCRTVLSEQLRQPDITFGQFKRSLKTFMLNVKGAD